MALVWVRANANTGYGSVGDRFQVDDAAPFAARMIAVGYWTVIPTQALPIPDAINTVGDVDAAFDALRTDPTSRVVAALALLGGLTDSTLTAALTTFTAAQARVRALALTEIAADTTHVAVSAVGAASGVASLDAGGKVPQAQIPAVALTEFLGAVASQTAMLALTGQRGDWCTRTDTGTDWQLIAEPASALASWRQRTYPASPVSSVAGRTGAVTIASADITDATAAATGLTVARRDAAGRLAVATPAATGDAATKAYVDAAIAQIAAPANVTWANAATFTDYDTAGYARVKYGRTVEGRVYLQGLMKSVVAVSTYPTTLFTLPVGFRPNIQELFFLLGNVGATAPAIRIDVLPSGAVNLMGGATTAGQFIPMEPIVFHPVNN